MKKKKLSSDFHQSKTAFYLMFGVAFIGALSWFPFLYDLFRPCDINFKILEFYEYIKIDNSIDNPDITKTNYDSKNYLLKLSVVSLNKDLDLKEIKCEGYDSLNNKVNISVRFWETLFYYDSEGTGNVEYALTLKKDDYLNTKSLFNKNENYIGFIGLTTDLPIKQIDKIKLKFITFNDRVITKEINSQEILKAKKQDPIFF